MARRPHRKRVPEDEIRDAVAVEVGHEGFRQRGFGRRVEGHGARGSVGQEAFGHAGVKPQGAGVFGHEEVAAAVAVEIALEVGAEDEVEFDRLAGELEREGDGEPEFLDGVLGEAAGRRHGKNVQLEIHASGEEDLDAFGDAELADDAHDEVGPAVPVEVFEVDAGGPAVADVEDVVGLGEVRPSGAAVVGVDASFGGVDEHDVEEPVAVEVAEAGRDLELEEAHAAPAALGGEVERARGKIPAVGALEAGDEGFVPGRDEIRAAVSVQVAEGEDGDGRDLGEFLMGSPGDGDGGFHGEGDFLEGAELPAGMLLEEQERVLEEEDEVRAAVAVEVRGEVEEERRAAFGQGSLEEGGMDGQVGRLGAEAARAEGASLDGAGAGGEESGATVQGGQGPEEGGGLQAQDLEGLIGEAPAGILEEDVEVAAVLDEEVVAAVAVEVAGDDAVGAASGLEGPRLERGILEEGEESGERPHEGPVYRTTWGKVNAAVRRHGRRSWRECPAAGRREGS